MKKNDEPSVFEYAVILILVGFVAIFLTPFMKKGSTRPISRWKPFLWIALLIVSVLGIWWIFIR